MTAGCREARDNLLCRRDKENPGVNFSLRNVLTSEQLDMLNVGTLDVGFLRMPVADTPYLEVTPIHSEPLVVGVPANHPLAAAKAITLKQLVGQQFLMYERTFAPGFHDFVAGILSRAGVVPDVVQTAGEMPTLVSLVDSGLGIALLPKSALGRKPAGVKVCSIKDRIPPSQIALVSAKRVRTLVVREFLAFTKSMFCT